MASLVCGISHSNTVSSLQDRDGLTDSEKALLATRAAGAGAAHTSVRSGRAAEPAFLCSRLRATLAFRAGRNLKQNVYTCVCAAESLCCTPEISIDEGKILKTV